MSLEAMLWAYKLPADRRQEISSAAHVTLIALADFTSDGGRGAFPSAATLADLRSLSVRTIRRHLAMLEYAGLIERGDQRLVSHLEIDRRPIVWDLVMAVDNSPKRGDTSVTPTPDRGDTNPPTGVTPDVTQSPITLTSESYVPKSPRQSEFSTDAGFAGAVVTESDHDESAGECIHGFSAGVSSRTGQPWCPQCRRVGVITRATPR